MHGDGTQYRDRAFGEDDDGWMLGGGPMLDDVDYEGPWLRARAVARAVNGLFRARGWTGGRGVFAQPGWADDASGIVFLTGAVTGMGPVRQALEAWAGPTGDGPASVPEGTAADDDPAGLLPDPVLADGDAEGQWLRARAVAQSLNVLFRARGLSGGARVRARAGWAAESRGLVLATGTLAGVAWLRQALMAWDEPGAGPGGEARSGAYR